MKIEYTRRQAQPWKIISGSLIIWTTTSEAVEFIKNFALEGLDENNTEKLEEAYKGFLEIEKHIGYYFTPNRRYIDELLISIIRKLNAIECHGFCFCKGKI